MDKNSEIQGILLRANVTTVDGVYTREALQYIEDCLNDPSVYYSDYFQALIYEGPLFRVREVKKRVNSYLKQQVLQDK